MYNDTALFDILYVDIGFLLVNGSSHISTRIWALYEK